MAAARRHSSGGAALDEQILNEASLLSVHQGPRQRSLSDSCGTGESNGINTIYLFFLQHYVLSVLLH
jgi:hypothetical protein